MIPAGRGLPAYLEDDEQSVIRGKAMMQHESPEDVWALLDYIRLLEDMLDAQMDLTDDWRSMAALHAQTWKR